MFCSEALALLVLSRRLAFGEPEVPQWQRLAAEGHPEVLVSKPKRLLFKRFSTFFLMFSLKSPRILQEFSKDLRRSSRIFNIFSMAFV